MMRKSIIFYFGLLSLVFLNNCSKAPVYPDTPQIEFANILPEASQNQLTVSLKFKDGNGDLGLTDDFKSYPYQEFDFVKDAFGNYTRYGSSSSLPPFTCKNYYQGDIDGDNVTDTVLINTNLNHFNYIIDVYYKQGSTFEKLDLSDVCPDFNGRFPLLASKDDKGPIEGTLDYKIPQFYSGIFYAFSKNSITSSTVKLKIYIQDRGLHKSNVIETPEITIN